MIELEHINKVLQGKEKVVNTLTVLLFSGIAILAWNLLTTLALIFNSSKTIVSKDIEYFKINLPFFIDVGFFIVFTAVIIYIYIIFTDLKSREKVINRKNLILKEIKKLSRLRAYNKTS